jgi:hypothetical protein
MGSLEDILRGNGGGKPQMGIHPVATRAQMDEVEKVRGMQVRSQALVAAVTLLAGTEHGNAAWHPVAVNMEAYIKGETDSDGTPSRLPS